MLSVDKTLPKDPDELRQFTALLLAVTRPPRLPRVRVVLGRPDVLMMGGVNKPFLRDVDVFCNQRSYPSAVAVEFASRSLYRPGGAIRSDFRQ